VRLEEKFDGSGQCAKARTGALLATRFDKGNSSSSSPQTATNQQAAVSGGGTAIGAKPQTISGNKNSHIAASSGSVNTITAGKGSTVAVTNNTSTTDPEVVAEALDSNNQTIAGAGALIGQVVQSFNNTLQQIAAPQMQPASTGNGGSAQAPTVDNTSGGGSVAAATTSFTTEDWLLIAGIGATIALVAWLS
jgi:hypothetical protein